MVLLNVPLFVLAITVDFIHALATPPLHHPTTGLSEVTGWTHFLNASAPLINTTQDFYELSDLHNGTIRIDRVNGHSIVIEHVSRAQIATLAPGSPLDVMAESVFPDLQVDKAALKESLTGAADLIEGFEDGSLTYQPLAEKNGGSVVTGGVSKILIDSGKVEGDSSLVAEEKIADCYLSGLILGPHISTRLRTTGSAQGPATNDLQTHCTTGKDHSTSYKALRESNCDVYLVVSSCTLATKPEPCGSRICVFFACVPN
ncbi:hypothetical protein LTR78_008224 [Recurvomyces mirabilis]|uniref:Uncharacterized protein n=1 Tax=Recurvomyces mirabilis TaxID=574656 RepID=A0AAE0TUX6_9PEZI|nr:hypothetical protein LTR78_008224 [Recurvomyces mirabilis]KAK5156509.1 hypothetical protein LTS14_004721 [Recurvomyces mirabilis]